MGTLFLPAAQNDQEMQADLQSQLSPSVGRAYSQVYNFDVLEGFTGAMVKQHALNDIANTGEKLSVDQLRKEYTDGRVNFDRPLTRAQAELIRDRKREELQRQDIWQRAEGWATASGVTASLAAGVVDPVGTAVGIVMAPAKGIQMLGGLRAMAASSSLAYRTLGTAGLTAVDAAIGNAILEPYNLYSHQQYYADYTMADSLANVVFGGVFGGAFGGGAVILGRGLSHVGKWTPEWLKGKQEATHETSLHTAVAQVLDGRPVQVEPILRSDPNLRMAEGHPVQAAEMAGPRVDEPAAALKPEPKYSPTEQENIARYYRQEGSSRINPELRSGKPSKEVLGYAQALDEWIQAGRAYAANKSVWRQAIDDEAKFLYGLKKGDTFTKDDFTSTFSTKKAFDYTWAGAAGPESGSPVIAVKIRLPKDTLVGRKMQYDSKNDVVSESEFLIRRNQKFEVTKVSDGQIELKLHNAPETPASMEFTAASGKEVLVQAKEHMEAPRTGAASDVAENFDAEIQATHMDTADYYEPAAKTRKMMELEKEIEYQQLRLVQEHGDIQVDGLKQADDALSKADDLRAAMVEGMACLLRR